VVRLLVYARHELIDCTPGPRPTIRNDMQMPFRWLGTTSEMPYRWQAPGGLSAGATVSDVALLLEGSWPSGTPGGSSASAAVHHSLDEAIDGRFDWIDQQAADFAELLGGAGHQPGAAAQPTDYISPAYLNALALRYYLVRLIRPLAYLTEVQRLSPGDRLELVAATRRDQDYAEVLSQYCRAAGVHYRVRWAGNGTGTALGFPVNGRWRRWIARLAGCWQPPPEPHGSGRCVVLCGNPRLLDPVCRELLTRGCRLCWLHDRFAISSWLRWQAAGVRQLACNSSLGRENRLSVHVPEPLRCRGVNLAEPIRRWLTERLATHGPRQTRLIEQIDAHFRRVRPDALVLDEDATPLARAAVAVGRRYGAGSFVVQHGVPYCRFGFTPPVADRILVWGRSSRQRLIQWGIPAERIRVTGSPQHEPGWGLSRRSRSENGTVPVRQRRGSVRILLLLTVPPRDERPDAVALHLTSGTYARMLRAAFAAVAGIDGAELIVKLHPRGGDDPVIRALQAEFPSLGSRLARRGRLDQWLAGVSCVLSCGSTAGVEATLAGVPVIQLAPPGASGFLLHEPWGLAGTAHSEAELRDLLARMATEDWQASRGPHPNVFADLGQPAAARVADEVLAPIDSVRYGLGFKGSRANEFGSMLAGVAGVERSEPPEW
jgi:hypothetical protein